MSGDRPVTEKEYLRDISFKLDKLDKLDKLYDIFIGLRADVTNIKINLSSQKEKRMERVSAESGREKDSRRRQGKV